MIFSPEKNGTALARLAEINGSGKRRVNIIFCNNLPKNIFQDFMYISKIGMASGDQSLSEFLSLTMKMPYYEIQPWKFHLFESISKIAKDIGGSELESWLSQRVVGRTIYGDSFSSELVSNLTKGDYSENTMANIEKFNKTLVKQTAEDVLINELSKKTVSIDQQRASSGLSPWQSFTTVCMNVFVAPVLHFFGKPT